MANRIFRSLFWFLLSLGLTVWAGLANAAVSYPYAPKTEYRYCTTTPACSVWVSDIAKACDMWASASGGTSGQPWTVVPPYPTPTQRTCTIKPNVTGSASSREPSSQLVCSEGGQLIGNMCQPDPSQCTDKNPFIRTWIYGPKGPYVPPKNFGGCQVVAEEMLVCRKVSSTTTHCMWRVRRTGDDFKGTENPNNGETGTDVPDRPELPPTQSPPISNDQKEQQNPDTPPCPAGTVQAGSDSSGIPICIGKGTSPTQSPPTTPPVKETVQSEPQEDGSTRTTTTTTKTNSDGSTTVHTTVTIVKVDGSRETVQQPPVTSNTPINTPGVEDKDDEKSDLCKLNPMLTICRNSSVNGSCGAISCQGDAIQCATLRAAAAMECKQRTDAEEIEVSPQHALGSAVLAGNDPMKAQLPTAANGSVVDVSGLKADGWLGAGAAFSDVSFSLLGQTVVIPLAKISGYLVGLRYALMVVASLVSFRILSGAILRE